MSYQAIAELSQALSAPLFIAVLIFVWIRYVQPAVLAAQEAQNARIAEAERHRDEAKATVESLRGEIDRAQADAQAINARAASQARFEENKLLAEAREAGERAIQNAQGELERGREAARMTLRDELLERSLDLARSEATRRVDASVNERLVHSFIGSLQVSGS